MYLSKIIAEENAGAGRRRVIIERPIARNAFIVKGIFRCPTEAKARELLDFLLRLKEPMAYTLAAPAAPKKRGRPKKTEDNNNE